MEEKECGAENVLEEIMTDVVRDKSTDSRNSINSKENKLKELHAQKYYGQTHENQISNFINH